MLTPLHDRLLAFAQSHSAKCALNLDGSVSVWIPWHRDDADGEREYGEWEFRCSTFRELREALGY